MQGTFFFFPPCSLSVCTELKQRSERLEIKPQHFFTITNLTEKNNGRLWLGMYGFIDFLMLSRLSAHAASRTEAFLSHIDELLHCTTAVGQKSASPVGSSEGGHKFHTQDVST